METISKVHKVNSIPEKLKWLFDLFGIKERSTEEKLEWQKEQMKKDVKKNEAKE